MNPTAILFWAFTGGVGYLIGQDLYSFVAGAVVGLGISLIVTLFDY